LPYAAQMPGKTKKEIKLLVTKRKAALKRGVDEVQALLEWLLRTRPRALANERRTYADFYLRLYRQIERASQGRRLPAGEP
jgi:hypothetical protein